MVSAGTDEADRGRWDVPSHVPSDLVVDFDFYVVAEPHDDIHPRWAEFVTRCREIRGGKAQLVYTPRNGGHWLAVTGEAVKTLYADATNLSNSSVTIPARPGLASLPGEADGDLHMASRMALMRWFTPTRVQSLSEPIHRIAADLTKRLQARGECNFMQDFAFQIPLHLFFELMQLPLSDGGKLLNAVDMVVRGSDSETVTAALEDIFAYVTDVIEMRKRDPGDDIISHIVGCEYRGEPLSQQTTAGMAVQLLLAGLDTVAATLGFIVQELARDTDLRRRLASGDLEMTLAIEEFLRRFPVVSLARVVANDFTYDGITMLEGERLLLPTPFYGLDDSVYERPLELDWSRPQTAMLTFGRGRHHCIGTLLARVELRAALTEWLSRIPDFAIAEGQQPTLSCGHVATFSTLPLVWSTKSKH